jgi:hypothetical protein
VVAINYTRKQACRPVPLTADEQMELEYEFAVPIKLLSDEEYEVVRMLLPWEMAQLPSDFRVAYFCTAKWRASQDAKRDALVDHNECYCASLWQVMGP